MKIRHLLSTACLLALALSACAGSNQETGAAAQTTPAAAAGEPATPAEFTTPAVTTPAATAPATTGATPAANIAQPAAPQLPTLAAVVTHKVKDLDAWKKAFDSHQDARKAAGIVGEAVMHDAKNPKIVTLWFPASDVAKLKAFTTSKELQAKMKEAGVEGKPTVVIMNSVEHQMDPTKPMTSAAMLTVTVKDFDAFKAAIDGSAQARTDATVVEFGLSQDVDNKNVAYVYLAAEDAAKLQAYVDSKETKKAWKDAGVKGTAKVSLMGGLEKPTFYQQ
jgi:quinol monooxygenase YgiN